ncbi:putative 3-oxoacyl-(acyl-carrier-protein) reductase protein [Eutypa lata UCREL1]|uniref:Putative 3-oxoacyl-(Acyl-carrier-protein) reductase protein n=1 Tax=Eutypa lata (strain UCR-EL1) TaxID=1287681 RepID=M7TJX0_EUTLA|nr:putative 3-oxoacyl-(acyl-carrier-protein) reductase protein [Eutypa lata UCREL1]
MNNRVLLGKRCVITGGSRGIGLAIAELFAAQGATCTLVGRNEAALSQAAARLRLTTATTTGGIRRSEDNDNDDHDHSTFAMDISNYSSWETLVARTKRGKTDILVNAAGMSQNSYLFRTGLADMRQILNVNLLGTTLGCQAFIPKMMKQKEGCIINVASLLATHAGRGASVYAASKAGIVGLTRSLAWEVGRFGIRANVLLPGYIETDMTKGMNDKGELSALIPMGRLGFVEEVADAALFLARNSYAHNCVLNIDGGLSGT